MAAYNSVYIGIYLEVKNSSRPKTETYYLNPTTNKEESTPFNSHTGQENVKKTREFQETVHSTPYEIEAEGFDEDEFFCPAYSGAPKGSNTWLINRYNEFRIKGHGDMLVNIEMEHIDIPTLKEKFKKHYHKFLEEVGKHFKYEIKYGIVYYAH